MMEEYRPLLGIFNGELDPYTKDRLEYYEKHKKKYVAHIGEAVFRVLNIVLSILGFALAIMIGMKIANRLAINSIWGLLMGIVIMLAIAFLYAFLIVIPVTKYLEKKDEAADRENDVFYDIVMQGTVMDKDHRAERIKADIRRMKAEGTWKEEYLTEELKQKYGQLLY